MSGNYFQNETDASRVLFLSSKDCRNISGSQHLTTHFELDLQQAIVVPPHHAIKMSVHRLTIPHTFYNLLEGRNTMLDIDLYETTFADESPTNALTGAVALSTINFSIKQGNYNAISLNNYIMKQVNSWLAGATVINDFELEGGGAVPSNFARITNPITDATKKGLKLLIKYNGDTLRNEWILYLPSTSSSGCSGGSGTPTFTSNNKFFLMFRFQSGTASGSGGSEDNPPTDRQGGGSLSGLFQGKNPQEELGFAINSWINDRNYDFWCAYSLRPAGGGEHYSWGASELNNLASRSVYQLRKQNTSDYSTVTPTPTFRDYAWGGYIPSAIPNNNPLPPEANEGLEGFKGKLVFSAVDLNFHIRSLYLRTNLSSHSVMDSKVNGRFTTLLARLPNDVESGEAIEQSPSDGSAHELILKTREIDRVEIQLTDVNGKLIDLNGLEWNVSIKFDFVVRPSVPRPVDDRLKIEHRKYKRYLMSQNLTKELADFEKYEKDILFPTESGT